MRLTALSMMIISTAQETTGNFFYLASWDTATWDEFKHDVLGELQPYTLEPGGINIEIGLPMNRSEQNLQQILQALVGTTIQGLPARPTREKKEDMGEHTLQHIARRIARPPTYDIRKTSKFTTCRLLFVCFWFLRYQVLFCYIGSTFGWLPCQL